MFTAQFVVSFHRPVHGHIDVGTMLRRRTLGLALALVFVVQVACNDGHASSQNECARVQSEFVKHNIGPSSLVPNSRIHDADMEICYKGARHSQRKSCCTRKMERKYAQTAEKDFYQVLRGTSSYLKNLISSSSAQYQEQFVTMIRAAENSTDTLFSEVYKMSLKDRRDPIDNLFMDLQAYIKRREVNVHDSVKQFFDELFPLVFHNIMNDPALSELNQDYKDCLMQIREQLNPKPFGEVPKKIAHHVAKSFLAARLFLEALALGIEVINTTDYIQLEASCTKALTRFQYCSHCDGHFQERSCKKFCHNVMRGCLVNVAELDNPWNEFTEALESLTVIMKGSYSIEQVLHGLHSKISEAIMHAMETGHKFYAKVVTKCGHPKSSKVTSSPNPAQKLDSGSKVTPANAGPLVSVHASIDNFVKSLKASNGFYRGLADDMCHNRKFRSINQDKCWNGHQIGTYNKTVAAIGVESQLKNNHEVRITQKYRSAMVSLKDKLAHVKNELKSKMTRDMQQADEWWAKGYSSGDRDDTQVDDEDYEDGSGSGSGGGPGTYPDMESPRKNTRKQPQSGNDFSFETTRKSNGKGSPYITKKPPQPRSSNDAVSLTRMYTWVVVIATALSMSLWLNG